MTWIVRLLALLVAVPFIAAATDTPPTAPSAASAPQRPASHVVCPRASEALPGRMTSKMRHVPDPDDPCHDSRGPGRPIAPAASR